MENTMQAWCCPAPGCGKAFSELWRLRAHYRQPIQGTAAARGHGLELLECPRCHEPLSLLKNARHRCKQAPARIAAAVAAAAAAAEAAAQAGMQEEESSDEGPLRSRKRRRVRWQSLGSGSGDSSGSEYEADEAADEQEYESPAPLAAAVPVAPAAAGAEHDDEHEGLPPPRRQVVQPPLPFPTPRGAAAAEMLVRISTGSAASVFSPPAVPLCAAGPPLASIAPKQVSAAGAGPAGGAAFGWWPPHPAVPAKAAAPAALLPPAPLPEPALSVHPPVQPRRGPPAAPVPPARLPQQEEQCHLSALHQPVLHHLPQHQLALQQQPLQQPAPQQSAPQQSPLADVASELLNHLLDLLKLVVSEAEAEEFASLVIRHTAERQGAALAAAPGAGGGTVGGSGAAAGASAGQPAQGDALLKGLVAELSVRCAAVRSLLEQQRHRELASAVQGALRAAHLASAVSQLSALLARQQQVTVQ